MMAVTYKIGEAAALLNLKSYVLRFWETEFPDIVPLRTEKGQRLYTVEHLALLQRIRYLLHDRGLTIGGARKVLAEEKRRGTVYTFQEPGTAPDMPPVSELSFPLAGQEDEGFDEDAPEGGEPGAEDALPPLPEAETARTAEKARGRATRPFSQYNLPGLEELVALRASVLDSGAGEAYSPVEEEAAFEPQASPASPASPASGGMLPLFAVARAAYLAGKASGGGATEGGGNFIHAGAVARPRGPACEGASGGVPSGEFLRGLARDLESVAALLRSGVPSEE